MQSKALEEILLVTDRLEIYKARCQISRLLHFDVILALTKLQRVTLGVNAAASI